MDWFDASTHSFATMATGGFSTRNTSLGAFSSPYIHVVVTIFMVLAGLNFRLYTVLVILTPTFWRK
ncbi:potassium transporter TrkG [Spirochaeta lutea]|nr:potassium transporter TrkG [Spirochaeta lutea]